MKGRLKFRRPFVVLDKKKTGGENFLKKVFSPRPPLSKTFDVIESLFAVFSKWQPQLNDGSCLFVWD